jgi:hypothetical protein
MFIIMKLLLEKVMVISSSVGTIIILCAGDTCIVSTSTTDSCCICKHGFSFTCGQTFGGDDNEGPEMSIKQIQKKLKSESSKLAKQAAKDNKKAEADRKKAAKALTKKVIATASKMVSPLATALHKAADVYQKVVAANAEEFGPAKEFKTKMDEIEIYKSAVTKALNFYSKNPAAELDALPFTDEKAAQTKIKELGKAGQDLKKTLVAFKKS